MQDLSVVVRYPRMKKTERVLCIHAICVSRKDRNERVVQVERMADVFGGVDRVVWWLGPEYKRGECFRLCELPD